MDTLDAALKYHALGWSLIPIKPASKLPACGWKRYQDQRAGSGQLHKWFGNGRGLNLAVICGEVSGGLVVRDFDTMESYAQWAAQNPVLAKLLPTVGTRRGRHVYCRADLTPIRQVSKNAGGILTFDDGELRGGGYCLLPPSTHPDGGRYRWLVPLEATLPEVDLVEAGLLPCNRDNGEYGENQEYREYPRAPMTETDGVESDNSPATYCPPLSESSRLSPSSLLQSHVEAIIQRTLPAEIGQRHKLAFRLARELKALPELADGPAEACKPVVRQWYDRWPAELRDGFELWWWDFAEGWDKVRYPTGKEPLTMLFTQAQANEGELPEVARHYDRPEVRLLVAFCRELQRASGDGPFFLGCRTAGGLFGVDHVTASRWLRGLMRDKILREVQKGDRAKRQASRYRYLGPM